MNTDFDLILLDWEMVGVGSGPQDIGQYMISHTAPEERRANEKMLVEHYYKYFLLD